MGGKLKTYMPAGCQGQRQRRGKGIQAGVPSGLPLTIHPGPGSKIKPVQQVGGEEQALDQRAESCFTATCTPAKPFLSSLHSLVCRAEA